MVKSCIVSNKVCLITDLHLCINPRLWKEAFFYEKEGYEVVVLGMWQSADLLQRDLELLKGRRITYKSYLNLIPGQIPESVRFLYRLRRRMAGEIQKWFKIGSGWTVSHAPERMFRFAMAENADLYAAHAECAFFVGRDLVKAGKKVYFDFEDWYSRDYLTPDRAVGLLQQVEEYALRNGIFCTAASRAMARALEHAYPGSKHVHTIYNSFPDDESNAIDHNESKPGHQPFRMIWTSRTVGPGRGLETLIQALHDVQHPVELHIIGKCADGYEIQFREMWPDKMGHMLVMHDFIPHHELLSRISMCDLGLAIELPISESRNTTVTNKILQYLQAGIPVLASDTEGQKEVAEYFPDAVFVVRWDKPQDWAFQINLLISGQYPSVKGAQKSIYRSQFSWAKQEEILKELISDYL
jgi:glycosyltransferase involved in cell wall biosynthesis